MKIAYDISMLGQRYGILGGGRGIDRVVENVLLGLIRSPEVDLTLTATHSLYGSRQVCRNNPEFAHIPILGTPWHEATSYVAAAASQYIQATLNRRAFWRRGLRFALTRLIGLEQQWEQRIPANLLNGCDIFHSPYHRLPTTVRKAHGLHLFLTIYDLIPLQTSGHPDAVRLKKILASIRPADSIICISEFVKNEICERLRFDPRRVFVTHLAASSQKFFPCTDRTKAEEIRRRYGIRLDTPYLLSLSAVEPRKNLPHLIACFGKLLASCEVPGLQLVLAGGQNPSQRDTLESYIARANLNGHVVLTRFVPDEDLPALYSGALAFVFPSLSEGFGLPPLEAMQCGVPVIASQASSLPEVVGDAGILVDPKDADALCEAVCALYRDRPLREKLAVASLRRAAEFSWERCVAQTIAAYRVALS